MTSRDKYQNEGYSAFHHEVYKNPYTPGTDAHRYWNEGWSQANDEWLDREEDEHAQEEYLRWFNDYYGEV